MSERRCRRGIGRGVVGCGMQEAGKAVGLSDGTEEAERGGCEANEAIFKALPP